MLTHHYKVKLLTGPWAGDTVKDTVKFVHDKVTPLQPPHVATDNESTTGRAAGSDAAPINADSHGGAAGGEQTNVANPPAQDFESLAHLFLT